MIWRIITSPLAGPIGAALFLAASLAVLALSFQVKSETRRADANLAEITRPGTGWAAQLATCQASNATLDNARATQNAEIEAFRAESARRSEASAKALRQAQDARRAAEGRITALLNRQPVSDDYCEQAREAEAMIRGAIR